MRMTTYHLCSFDPSNDNVNDVRVNDRVKVAEIVEGFRRKCAGVFGVTVQGNRLTLRYADEASGTMRQLSAVILEVNTLDLHAEADEDDAPDDERVV